MLSGMVLQDICRVEDRDTPETLAEKIHAIEHVLIVDSIKKILGGKLEIQGNRVQVYDPVRKSLDDGRIKYLKKTGKNNQIRVQIIECVQCLTVEFFRF